MKLVSIILPTYNGAKFIKESIESVINQTYTNWELIIVNDCSTDDTAKIIEEYTQKDSRIKVITNKENKKLPASLNIGFEHASGDYYTWTSDDNAYKKDAIKYMSEFLDNNQEIDLISCNADFVDENGVFINEFITLVKNRCPLQLAKQCNIGACFMYRKEIAEKAGEYNTEMFCAEDYDYWCKIALAGRIAYSDKNLYTYSLNRQSLTSTKQTTIKEKTLAVQQKYKKALIEKYKKINIKFYLSKILLQQISSFFYSKQKLKHKTKYKVLGIKITHHKNYFKNKLAIWGWWQGKNLGDQWIKKCMQKLFPQAVFIDTDEKRLNEAAFVICGGGGLWIDDVHKTFKQKLKIPFGVIGLGAEFPYPDDSAKTIKNNAEFFFVRDQYSLDCMHINDTEPSRDITFSFPLKWVAENNIDTSTLFFVWRDGKIFYEQEKDNFIKYGKYKDNYSEFVSIIEQNFKNIKYDDFQVYQDNIEERIKNAGFVISGRYHGIIAAIQKGIPCIGIDICPKIRALMKDCNLEEYCIKMEEVNKLDFLIKKAKQNVLKIREKQYKYRQQAIDTIQKDIKAAKNKINKYIKPFQHLNGIHYGAYWMGKNDVINVMSDDLSDLCNLQKIDLKLYSKKKDNRIKKSIKTPNGYINYLDTKKIIKDIQKYNADFILLNSGGFTLEDDCFQYCRNKNITVVGTVLSDPDVYPYNGAVYADKFDLFYTNSLYSLENQYDKNKVNINLLPFAASTKHHYYMPEIPKTYDVVVIGHARENRKRVIKKLSEFNLGLYGDGWENGLGKVQGEAHTKAINSGKIYLSFAETVAGYNNVKVGLFEAIACNTFVITRYMEELDNYFKIGKEVVCYHNEDELVNLIKYYLSHEEEREQIREASYKKFLNEHTYHKRAEKMLVDINNFRNKI